MKFKALLRHSNFDVPVRAHCSFEAQQERICDYAVQNESMDLCKQFLSPRDLVSIGYVTVNAKQNPVKHLRVSAFLHAESLEAFIKELRRGSNCVESLHVDILKGHKQRYQCWMKQSLWQTSSDATSR